MNKNFRLAIAQINPTLGDMKGNAEKIIEYSISARDKLKADVVVFSELALTGYPPEDLLLRNDFYDCANKILQKIQNAVEGIYIILGYPYQIDERHYNAAAVIYNKKIIASYCKRLLPNYGVFDEKRYFQPGTETCVVNIKGACIGLNICEDLWEPEPVALTVKAGAQLIVSINASPFDMHKPLLREHIISSRAKENNVPIVYVNCIGGQDELIFDGGSMVLNAKGEIVKRVNFFEQILSSVDFSMRLESPGNNKDWIPACAGMTEALENDKNLVSSGARITGHHGNNDVHASILEPVVDDILILPSNEELIYKALVLGVHDYVEKNNFKRALIGLSGGIDSALTVAIAVDAIGKDRVTAVSMPSRYTRDMSIEDAEIITKNLGIKHEVISIEPVFKAFLASLIPEFEGLPTDITEENLQARCRGVILMALSNKTKAIVLSTGNKSEMAVGYATLYGDMVGGFCVLKDVFKTMVYRLVEYRNNIAPIIPKRVITRPPSAELALNQVDQDALPPYPILDAILERYVENDKSMQEIVADGFDKEIVKKVLRLIDANEYKRRQAPPGIKITARAFGRDRRYPITSKYSLLECD